MSSHKICFYGELEKLSPNYQVLIHSSSSDCLTDKQTANCFHFFFAQIHQSFWDYIYFIIPSNLMLIL